MSKETKNKQNQGFSLVETLAVVAILVILLGLSTVAAAYYRDYLKITELDNAAREIYMAAENRAVLLDNGGQLDGALGVTILAEGGAPASPLVFTKDEVVSKGLLTTGAIDPALLDEDGNFYIVYDPASGGVTDVFYTEGPGAIQPIDYAFSIAGDRDARMKETPMLGYYGGQQTARKDYTPLPAPEVMVVIHNEDLLTVDVTFSVPDAMFTATQTVELHYKDRIVQLDLLKASSSVSTSDITYTWVLDALDRTDDNGAKVEGRHFWQLFASNPDEAPVCGGDFTVTATMELSAPGRRPTSASGSDTDNSLFAENSGGTTARLENLRHLQNLDAVTSKAGEKTSAILLKDIDCCGKQAREPYGLYEFKPIVNEELRSFDGGWTVEDGNPRRNEVTDLRVTATSASGRPGAGLFAKTKDGVTFTGVRLIDADVSAGTAPAAGVLVGSAGSGTTFRDIRVVNSKAVCPGGPAGGVAGEIAGLSITKNLFTDCQVYWEPEEGQDNLRSLLGSDQKNNPYKYEEIICGTYAGGLVGKASGSATAITKSLVSSLVSGTSAAGGLVGQTSYELTLKGSYSDCYLAGEAAAGLVGSTDSTLHVTNCYAAGFIDSEKAAGLSLGDNAKVDTHNFYSVMSFTGSASKTVYMMTESQTKPQNDEFFDTYHLGAEDAGTENGKKAVGLTYDEMIHKNFVSEMGTSFESKKVADSHPYNLQETQKLNPPYIFPGLTGLPHYGDWQAYFKEPSLVYYEEYSETDPVTGQRSRGFSGGNARTLEVGELKEGEGVTYPTVKTDGYAVALLQSDLKDADRFAVTYTRPTKDGATTLLTVTYVTGEPKNPEEVQLLAASWTRQEGDTPDRYWLAPLPEELVVGSQTTPDFYQYLRFQATVINASGEYFYNPHFAETVKPYVPENGTPLIDWTATPSSGQVKEAIHQYISQTLTPGARPFSVSVRTPRHLFHLSQYEDYYNNVRLAFQQGLPLDGHSSVYTGHPGLLKHEGEPRRFQLQSPIGTQAAYFAGSYDGGCLPIRRVAFQIPEGDQSRVCAGLFGSSNGTLKNINYTLDPRDPGTPVDPENPAPLGDPRSINFYSSEKHTYLGALVGLNRSNGKILNCTVDSVNLTSQIFTTQIYIGGLCGKNEGTVQNSAAESALLRVDASNYGSALVGGLTGSNTGRISESYAVGRLDAEAAQDNAPILLAGFAGQNSGSISNSYSAMDLKTDGVKASAYGFCGPGGGRQNGTFYLNNGNFSYRGEPFLAKYEEASATPLSYLELTAEKSPVSGMDKVSGSNTNKDIFPYPTGVKKGTAAWHYGDWPKALKLGSMGVYYWEELKIPGKAPSYHVSLLAVDPGENAGDPKTVTKISTLSTAHDEDGEVTRFGYGIYNAKDRGVQLQDTPLPLLYSVNGGAGERFDQKTYDNLEAAKAAAASSSGSQDFLNRQVDEELTRLMTYELGSEFQFHSFHSFGLHGNVDAGDRNGGQGGLYPNSNPTTPNGTLTLFQSGDSGVTITFALNPLFAEALAVQTPDGGWTLGPGVPEFWVLQYAGETAIQNGTFPGSGNNPYGVRSIAQLQLIDWNSANRNTDTVLVALASSNPNEQLIETFPYLSQIMTYGEAQTGNYYWKQSYDILGEKQPGENYETYSPIAEYYDSSTGDQASLSGWFGGNYDGGSYKIENVNIEGQVSSCAGLFGLVYNAHLKDIVLYSSDGKGTISTKAAGSIGADGKRSGETKSLWYAMGALAGVAGTSEGDSKPVIENCTVAGYTIDAHVYTHTEQGNGGYGGNNIGGLVGACDLSLTGCSAVTTINVHDAVENDNMRIGGLTGVCQGVVENCYAGGSISVKNVQVLGANDSNPKGIYVGGLVGGAYMRPLKIQGSSDTIGVREDGNTELTNNTLRGCYSYVTLPPLTGQEAQPYIKSMYVIGGTGEIGRLNESNLANHGVCTMENCYFLTSEVLANYTGGETGYRQAIATTGAKTDIDAKSSGGGGSGGSGDIPVYEVGKEYPITEDFQLPDFVIKDGTVYFYSVHKFGSSLGDGMPMFTVNYDTLMATFRGYVTDYADDSNWGLTSTPPDGSGSTEIPAITGLTYEQLSGPPSEDQATNEAYLIDGDTIYDRLTAFHPVSTEEDGISVPGKYSYSTQLRPELRDRNYPFPTVLTKDNQKYQVHYGDWPLKGFERRALDQKTGAPLRGQDGEPVCLGGSPIEIDLFVSGGAVHREHLVLTEGVALKEGTQGQWTCTWKSSVGLTEEELKNFQPIAQAEVSDLDPSAPVADETERSKTFLFSLTPKKNGTDDLYLSYTYTDTEDRQVTYTLPITVHITAEAELRPSRLFMFPNDTMETTVRATDQLGIPLTELIPGGKLTLNGDPNCGSEGYLQAETLTAEATEDGKLPAIRFTTRIPDDAAGLGEDSLTLGATAPFSYIDPEKPEIDYGDGGNGDIRIEVICPWKGLEDFILWEDVEISGITHAVCTISFPNSHSVGDEGTLHFARKDGEQPSVAFTPNRPSPAWKDQEGRITVTLTYPVALADLPEETKVSIPLTLTSSGEAEGQELIEGKQFHTLLLTVKKPAEDTAETLLEPQTIEALPVEDGQADPSRRRRWRRKSQRRHALVRKF